jgi:succinoglycan biosynthesis transport protein ExoP
MTRSVARHAKAGLPEVLHEGEDVRNVLLYNAQTKLIFLPGATGGQMPHSLELLGSPAMGELLIELGAHLDYIVIDLPPLGPAVDVRAIADKVDGFLLVVEWGKTSRKLVRQILDAEPLIRVKCIGAVLNNVDRQQMKLYGSFGSAEFYQSRDHRYFR